MLYIDPTLDEILRETSYLSNVNIDPTLNKILHETSNLSKVSSPSLKSYKTNLKNVLLENQGHGSPNEWEYKNFLIYNITGLRKSQRNNKVVDYAEK